MLPENCYAKNRRSRCRLNYHRNKEQYKDECEKRCRLNYRRNKEQYKDKCEKRRFRCIAYMKQYNKEYYQEKREEILEKNKAYGHEVRAKAGRKTKPAYIPAEPVIVKVDPSVFTILFDD